LVPGGIIVLDDYGWRKQINQKIAFDRFADARKISVLTPDGPRFADKALIHLFRTAHGTEQASDRPLSVASKPPGNCGPQSRKRPVDDPRVG
jgi:hypothetical protein